MKLSDMPRGYRLQIMRYLPRIKQELLIKTIYNTTFKGRAELVSDITKSVTFNTEYGPLDLLLSEIETIDIVISDWSPEKIEAIRNRAGK